MRLTPSSGNLTAFPSRLTESGGLIIIPTFTAIIVGWKSPQNPLNLSKEFGIFIMPIGTGKQRLANPSTFVQNAEFKSSKQPTTNPNPTPGNVMKKSDAIIAWNRSKQLHALTLHLAILGAVAAILAARIAYLLNN
jgi:hypothetical protein